MTDSKKYIISDLAGRFICNPLKYSADGRTYLVHQARVYDAYEIAVYKSMAKPGYNIYSHPDCKLVYEG